MTDPSSFTRFKSRLAWDEIDRESVNSLLHLCLIEERGKEEPDSCLGDVTTDSCKITGLGKASIVAREPMILCGIGLFPLIANAFGVPQVKCARQVEDGTPLNRADRFEFPAKALWYRYRCKSLRQDRRTFWRRTTGYPQDDSGNEVP